jgi:hypothetical protein
MKDSQKSMVVSGRTLTSFEKVLGRDFDAVLAVDFLFALDKLGYFVVSLQEIKAFGGCPVSVFVVHKHFF